VALAKELGGAERIARQHEGGRLTVRERIDRMLDPGSFHEIGAIAGKATYDADSKLITGFTPANCVFGRGTVDGRPVVIAGDDFTLRGGWRMPRSRASRRCRSRSRPSSACRSSG
jgi:acetyl-CoA carboxylase carboxyltransferase component